MREWGPLGDSKYEGKKKLEVKEERVVMVIEIPKLRKNIVNGNSHKKT